MTSIEWVKNADGSQGKTWNPVVGCSIVSPGCTNCYAMKMAARIEAMGNQPRYAGTTKRVNGNAVWTGKLAMAPKSTLYQPLDRRKPTVYFVNSMGDLFHEDIPDDWILDVLTVMAVAHRHTFQILTKRAARMRDFMSRPRLLEEIYLNWYTFSGGAREVHGWPLPNVWLGVSTERQQEADERIPLLLQTPAAIRFISAEPLLGPIDLTRIDTKPFDGTHAFVDALSGLVRCGEDTVTGLYDQPDPKLDWVIVGGESGPDARPMDPEWALSLRDQCQAAVVPFFFKQWGAFVPETRGRYRKVSKKAAGRLLDGVEHNGMPGGIAA